MLPGCQQSCERYYFRVSVSGTSVGAFQTIKLLILTRRPSNHFAKITMLFGELNYLILAVAGILSGTAFLNDFNQRVQLSISTSL